MRLLALRGQERVILSKGAILKIKKKLDAQRMSDDA